MASCRLLRLRPPAKPVHETKDAFADLEQLFPRLGSHRVGQKLPGRRRLQSGLRLVQMIQRALQRCDLERRVGEVIPASDAVQGPGQLGARSLELENELCAIICLG